MLSLAEIGAKFIEWLISIPAVRTFCEALVLKGVHDVAAEIFFRNETDPVFRSNYLALAAKLKLATTVEEKRAVLTQLNALRRS